MSLWTEDDGHVPNHYWPILLTLTSNNCLSHSRVKPVIWRQYPSLKGRISWHVADPTSREGWISFYWHVIVSLVVFEFEESWCTSDLCSFSNPRRKGWWEAFCPIQISQRCNCRVGDSKSGTSDKVTEQTATTNNPGPGSALAQLFCLLSTMMTQGQKRKSRKWARDARNHRDVCVPWLVRDGGTLLRADLRMTFVCCAVCVSHQAC